MGRIRRVYLIIVIALVAFFGISFGFLEFTSRPSFCKTCHYMEPYYESWKASKHSDVNCLKCHFPPGFGSYIKGKLASSTEVVNYVVGTYKRRKPWAEIEDESCLREGCHERRTLEGKVPFKKTVFDHQPHLTELRAGMKLRCTSCHSQIVQREHIKVTESTCFLCHFSEGKVREPISGCPSCHGAPTGVVRVGDEEVKHESFLKAGIVCTKCHTSVISGKGEVPLESCISCHAEPERIERYNEVDFLHAEHVSEHNVECSRCHLEIKHELPSPESPPVVACNSCHGDYHSGQRTAFKGAMLQIHPSCQNCHEAEHGRKVSCQPCHRKEILNLVSIWKDEIRRSKSELISAVRKLEGFKDEELQGLLQEIRSSINALKEENLIHNVRFANSEILSIYDRLQEVFSLKDLEFESRHLQALKLSSQSPCFSCHFGVETKRLRYSGKSFIHTPHIAEAEMECSDCHEETAELDESHGKLTISPSDCEACH
jgi:nitrate/TMAO reductase-like tetraheme cytochrome c subunit